jgi:hypothetical protein
MTKIAAEAAIEAVAESWAELDGKSAAFAAGKGKPIHEQPGAHYDGYLADAESLIRSLAKRGFHIAKTERKP